jgi:putative component of membrane protein insertase Oxa1/YidC/SpoIIIJ protein YidD
VLAVAATCLSLGSCLASARAADAEPAPPPLWEPGAAAAFLLDAPAPTPAPTPSRPWDGSLSDAIVRGFFGTYRAILSSQDLPLCGFKPSCSAFSQRALARCGLFHGALLTIDRLLRDHPLAVGFYPMAPNDHLLEDAPELYCPTASP